MEKTITIDGKSVRLKTSGAFPLRFKAQFHEDFFSKLMGMTAFEKLGKKKKLTPDDLAQVDFDIFYDLVWTMAKTADPSIPEPMTWLDGFETFPIVEIIPEIQDMLTSMVQTKKNV